jgi:hypothetical protein
MGIFDITLSVKAIELLPPDKRSSTIVAWIKQLYKPLQQSHYALFVSYKTGSTAPQWTAGTYAYRERVIYGQTVYESLTDGNTAIPTDTNYWRVYQDSFIGVDERLTYNHQKLVLQYALNTRFGTTFNQPPTLSDIYITTNAPGAGVFVVGASEGESSTVYADVSSEYVINSYSFSNFYNFTINVPVAVYTALGSAADSVIRGFVDRYNSAGVTYNIVTY